jgi:hypothetical protein
MNWHKRHLAIVLLAWLPIAAFGQELGDREAEVLSVAEAALEAITAGDWTDLADLMIDEATTVMSRERDGEFQHRVSTRADTAATPAGSDIVERGFGPEVRVAGTLGMVWLPYDLYVDGEWSHCGVDTFTLIETAAGWRIVSLAYSIEQPPACRPHPDGPPVLVSLEDGICQ